MISFRTLELDGTPCLYSWGAWLLRQRRFFKPFLMMLMLLLDLLSHCVGSCLNIAKLLFFMIDRSSSRHGKLPHATMQAASGGSCIIFWRTNRGRNL
jgi:hypothetical protein